MRSSFHPAASFFGYYNGTMIAGFAQALFDWVDQNGPAVGTKTQFGQIDVRETIALVRVEMEGMSRKLSLGGHARLSDFFTLLKTDGRWLVTPQDIPLVLGHARPERAGGHVPALLIIRVSRALFGASPTPLASRQAAGSPSHERTQARLSPGNAVSRMSPNPGEHSRGLAWNSAHSRKAGSRVFSTCCGHKCCTINN